MAHGKTFSAKQERRDSIKCGLGVKDDCFAFDKEKRQCTALTALYCASEKCNFYKPRRRK